MHALPQTGVLTFLFTDIEGSTTRWDRAPEAMAGALAAHDAILSGTIEAQSGSVFKRVGDAFCCVFASPERAAMAAVDVQRKLAEERWDSAVGELRVRIGLHTGSALESDDDYFGPALNRVARLMSAGHGGQILLSAATATLVRGELPPDLECRSLGTHRLRDLAEPETIFQLTAPDLQKDFPALRTLDARPNNLPLELSSFVGRESELRELRELVAQHRLVTLCGPGGIGKTRLALQLGAELLDDFNDGVWFVALASTSDPKLIAQTIASALGIGEAAGEPIEATLLRQLAAQRLLLVLDNAEHLLPAIAKTVKLILDRAKDVSIVTSTQESLHVRGERVYRLGPFDEADAERLFIERAQAIAHAFVPSTGDYEDFAAISRALQGIPLAIELAAARLSTLSLRQIRERLGDQLALLRTSAAEDDRHKTLRETIAWSYELLDDAERKLLGELSVFVGGFSLEACETVASSTRGTAVLDILEELVDKSFLAVQRADAGTRYRMLEVIREYAGEQSEAAVLAAARARHFELFAALATKGSGPLLHEALGNWLDAVDGDAANVRAALVYGFENTGPELGQMLLGMFRYWYIRRTVKEGRRWLQRYIDAAGPEDTILAGILRRAATFASIEGAYDAADSLAKRSLTIYHEAKDQPGVLEALHALAVNENRRGNYSGAERLYSDIAVRCTEAGQERAAVSSSTNCAAIKLQRGDLDAAELLLSECRTRAERLGDEDVCATVIATLGTLAYKRGDWEQAKKCFTTALATKRKIKNEFGIAEILAAMAVLENRNDCSEARSLAGESLHIALRLDALELIVNSLEACAAVALCQKDVDGAKDAFALSLAMRRVHSLREMPGLDRDRVDGELRERYGRELDESVTLVLSGNLKTTAQALSQRFGERSEVSVT
ncbi:MAG TPA: adenylate/guanylate cyclase domain-containing protein [Candidatus Rubrimentiphilum sp.]|nr:adenylate/guanylate cyclase domain-containing protein [Candidatus Rubrimentiphilum sp.]